MRHQIPLLLTGLAVGVTLTLLMPSFHEAPDDREPRDLSARSNFGPSPTEAAAQDQAISSKHNKRVEPPHPLPTPSMPIDQDIDSAQRDNLDTLFADNETVKLSESIDENEAIDLETGWDANQRRIVDTAIYDIFTQTDLVTSASLGEVMCTDGRCDFESFIHSDSRGPVTSQILNSLDDKLEASDATSDLQASLLNYNPSEGVSSFRVTKRVSHPVIKVNFITDENGNEIIQSQLLNTGDDSGNDD